MLVFGTQWKLWFPNPGKPKENNFETCVFYMYKFFSGFPCATMEIPPFLRAVEMITSRFRSLNERGNPSEVSKVSVFYYSIFKIFVVFHFRKVQLSPCGFLRNGHRDLDDVISIKKKNLKFFLIWKIIEERIVLYLTIYQTTERWWFNLIKNN